MRLLKGVYNNFGSYALLDFDFSNMGLALVSGPTGAGKSTLMDMPCWCLFGITSKEGTVDEVKAWGADTPTSGDQQVELSDGSIITVTRIRGKAQQNDLYWIKEGTNEQIRGKDITETQAMLEQILGVTAELYFTAGYFHQFSKADSFFIAKAKERREVLEKIADLSLPVSIAEGSSEHRKIAKKELEAKQQEFSRLDGRSTLLYETKRRTEAAITNWTVVQKEKIQACKEKSEGFEETKEKLVTGWQQDIDKLQASVVVKDFDFQLEAINRRKAELGGLEQELYKANSSLTQVTTELKLLNAQQKKFSTLSGVCPTCLGPTDNSSKAKHLKELKEKLATLANQEGLLRNEIQSLTEALDSSDLEAEINQIQEQIQVNSELVAQIERLEARKHIDEQLVNTYEIERKQLAAQVNPYKDEFNKILADMMATEGKAAAVQREIKNAEHKIVSLTQLYDMSLELRGRLLENAVKDIEARTNSCLEKYFESEIHVSFELAGDKLEVSLQKNGYECSFRQLSGGQRCMLKLAFGVALMKAAANTAGVHFSNLFFDEALNGLDEELKIKAFGLFQELESDYESVCLIDHAPEFKNLFANQYLVKIEGDNSTIVRAEGDTEGNNGQENVERRGSHLQRSEARLS